MRSGFETVTDQQKIIFEQLHTLLFILAKNIYLYIYLFTYSILEDFLKSHILKNLVRHPPMAVRIVAHFINTPSKVYFEDVVSTQSKYTYSYLPTYTYIIHVYLLRTNYIRYTIIFLLQII